MDENFLKMVGACSGVPNYPEFKAAFDTVMIQKLDNHFEHRTAELFSPKNEE